MKTVKVGVTVWSLLSSIILWWFIPGSLSAQTRGTGSGVYITINQLPVDTGGMQSIAEQFFGTSSAENPVEISLDNPSHKVATIDMSICDDDNYLLLTGCEITNRTAGFLCRSGESEGGPEWAVANPSHGASSLRLTQWLTSSLDLQPRTRLLDLGYGRACSTIFVSREFGVQILATDL